ncbi:MAG TPA: hypothetical protein PKA27_01570 [Fimbriimonadaceae bacterium]|nr:hypothetical protein [Fimbriimonadaceae bacterium]
MSRSSLLTKQVESDWKVSGLGLIAPPPITIESPHFSGSLATLFEVVQAHKVDLRDVPLLPICEAYFRYLAEQPEVTVDEAAAALCALCFLLERKAWLLLPSPEPEPEELLAFEFDPTALGELEVAIAALEIWHEERSNLHFRSVQVEQEVELDFGGVSISDLARAFEELLAKAEPEPMESLAADRRSIHDQIRTVREALTRAWATLPSLVQGQFTRTEAVWWFLALLEMIRQRIAKVRLVEGEPQFALI